MNKYLTGAMTLPLFKIFSSAQQTVTFVFDFYQSLNLLVQIIDESANLI